MALKGAAPTMDEVDATILRLLAWHPLHPVDGRRVPYGLWDIARQLDVHGNTVKRRLADLEDEGILQGLGLFPNGADIGIDVYGVLLQFDDAPSCRAAEEAILELNRPGGLTRFGGNRLLTNILVGREEQVADAAEACRSKHNAVSCDVMTPRAWGPAELTDLEHRVLMRLVADPLATPPEVADAVGVTPKTARRCIVSLRAKQAFLVVPLTNYAQATGMVAVNLEIEGSAQAYRRAMEAVPDLVMAGTLDAAVLSLHGFAATLGEQASMVERLRSVPGVTRVDATVIESWHWTGTRPLARAVSEGLAGMEQWVERPPG